jgi:hypothetical protein
VSGLFGGMQYVRDRGLRVAVLANKLGMRFAHLYGSNRIVCFPPRFSGSLTTNPVILPATQCNHDIPLVLPNAGGPIDVSARQGLMRLDYSPKTLILDQSSNGLTRQHHIDEKTTTHVCKHPAGKVPEQDDCRYSC